MRRVETVASRIDENKEKRRIRNGKGKNTYLDNNKEYMRDINYLAFGDFKYLWLDFLIKLARNSIYFLWLTIKKMYLTNLNGKY